MYTQSMQIILASSSPRRQSLLSNLGLEIHCQSPNITECRQPEEPIVSYVRRNAREKGEAIAYHLNPSTQPDHGNSKIAILSGDTVVICKDKLLEKPHSEEHAFEMLSMLSNAEHTVMSAIHLIVMDKCKPQTKDWAQHQADCFTTVFMRQLSTDEINAYIATKEPMDKAGAYGLQGLGSQFVSKIHGSPTNVIGLPMAECVALLQRQRVITPSRQ